MDKRKILVFVTVSYAFSWFFWGKQALNHSFYLGWDISIWDHFIGGLGPFIGAILTTLIFENREGLKKYTTERLLVFPSATWLIIGFGMPIVFFFIPYFFWGSLQNEWLILSELGLNSKVPLNDTVSIWLMWCFFYGLGGEGGWRGFLFPELCKKYKARTAAFHTAFFALLWYLPVFIYDKNFQIMSVSDILLWAVGLAFGSLILAWLVKQSNRSLWAAVLWQGSFNLFTTSDLIDPVYPKMMSILIIAFAMWVVRKYDEDLHTKTSTK